MINLEEVCGNEKFIEKKTVRRDIIKWAGIGAVALVAIPVPFPAKVIAGIRKYPSNTHIRHMGCHSWSWIAGRNDERHYLRG